jgi:hypothetical protein
VNATEFRALISDHRLVKLFDYWQEIRDDRSMPEWSDIKAEEIAPVLPHAWAWRVDESGELRLRLAGESIVQVLELNVRDKTPFDFYAPAAAKVIIDRFHRVMSEPTCSFSIGEVFYEGKSVGTGQRIALPYRDKKTLRKGVIGASSLEKRNNQSKEGGATIYNLDGNEYYLKL